MIKISVQKFLSSLKNSLVNKEYWLCFLAGLSLVFAYAPFSQWYLSLFVPAIAFYQLAKKSPKTSAKLMFLFAFGWFASGISWVHVSIDQFGGLPLIASLGLMLILVHTIYIPLSVGLPNGGKIKTNLLFYKTSNSIILKSVPLFYEQLYFKLQ